MNSSEAPIQSDEQPPGYLPPAENGEPDPDHTDISSAQASPSTDLKQLERVTEPLAQRKPGELSPALAEKCSKAVRARILRLKHYRPNKLNNDGQVKTSYMKRTPLATVDDAIMLPDKLLFTELCELLQSRLELKHGDLGLKTLEGVRKVVVVRGKGGVQLEVVDQQSWYSTQIFVSQVDGYILEYGVVEASKENGGCVLQ